MGEIENLDLLLESHGGDIDSATKIVKSLRTYCKRLSVIVPFFAKSAATLIALAADKIVMCRNGELGPIDPQVPDPTSHLWIPAHSIQEAIRFIEETTDQLVKLTLADKIPPLLIGAYRDSLTASKQYLDEVLEPLGEKKREAVKTFTTRFLSHGYPIDRKLCKDVGLNVLEPGSELESKICDLHEIYEDLILSFVGKTGEDQERDILIIQGEGQRCVVFGDEEISNWEEGSSISSEKHQQ